MKPGALVFAAALLAAFPSPSPGQIAVRGGVQIARAEHRVVDAGMLVASSGTLFGGTLVLTIGRRYEIQGEALGGRLTAGSTSLEDHDLAEAHLLGGMKLRPWLTLQSGLSVRNYSNALARQHWTLWRIGAETRVPLGFEGVRAVIRGYWVPMVHVSGLPRPDVALAAGAGMDWQGRRINISALYSFDRYDFPPAQGSRRLEALSGLRIRVAIRWPA